MATFERKSHDLAGRDSVHNGLWSEPTRDPVELDGVALVDDFRSYLSEQQFVGREKIVQDADDTMPSTQRPSAFVSVKPRGSSAATPIFSSQPFSTSPDGSDLDRASSARFMPVCETWVVCALALALPHTHFRACAAVATSEPL